MRHETLLIQRDVSRWRERCRPVLAVDFHGPGGSEDRGAYAFLPDPDKFPDVHKASLAWTAAMVQELTPKYAADEFDRVVRYLSRWETPSFTKYFSETFGIPGISIETPYGLAGETVLTREEYREIGARMARAVAGRLR